MTIKEVGSYCSCASFSRMAVTSISS